MKISIIIPFYNTYLTHFVELVNQLLTLSKDYFQIILINDGSNSKDILNYIKEKHLNNMFDIINANHVGVSHARNIGIKFASNEYIMFVDSDDLINIDLLNHIVESSFNFDILFFSATYQKEDLFFHGKLDNLISDFDVENIYCNDRFLPPTFSSIGARSCCGKLIKRELLTNFNILFQENLVYCEDCLFCGELYKHIKNYAFVSLPPFYFYRINEKSQTRKFDFNFITRYTLFFNSFIELNHEYSNRIEFAMYDTLAIHLNVRVCMSIKHFHWIYARKVVSSKVMRQMAVYFRKRNDLAPYRRRICFYIRHKLYFLCILLIVLKRIPISLKIKFEK